MVGDGFGGRGWYVPHNYQVGSYSAYTVCGDSDQLYSWGGNNSGELGDGTFVSSVVPVKVIGMTNVRFYATGYVAGVIKKDNTAWVWGSANHGFSTIPKQLLNDVKFLDGAISHIVFVKTDGTVWAAGENYKGELGNGLASPYGAQIPKQMTGITNAVRAIAVDKASIILLSDGTLKVTGGGGVFQAVNSTIPVAVNGVKDIVDIKGNTWSAYALDKNGNVFAFGQHPSFLGLGAVSDNAYIPPTKMTFPAGAAPIVALSSNCDGYSSLALDSNHNVYGWGSNFYGELGLGNNSTTLYPTLITSNAVDIFAGETFCYILKSDSTLWASGQSAFNGSIWMNLANFQRNVFTKIDPAIAPMNLCSPKIYGIYQPACPASAILNNQNVFICSGSQFQLPSGKFINTPGIYYDTLKTLPGCDSIISNISLSIFPVNHSNQNISICPGTTYQLSSGALASAAGIYYDTIKNTLGCDSLISQVNLSVYPASSNNITDSFYLGQTYTLPSGEIVNTPGKYQYILKDAKGCDSTIDITLLAKSTAGCVKPIRAFTPNGDGLNEVWKISTEGCVKRIEVSVYNRWGNRVYYSKDYHNDWDGNYKNNRLPDGTYYYLVNVTFYDDRTVELRGNVTIMR